jgi:threonine dehydrogenase-like Zn-dependent dehydrogenase
MRAASFPGPGQVRIEEVPVPQMGEGEVLVRTRASGICGSDKGLWEKGAPGGKIAGHEGAGEVVKVGPGVNSFVPGDRVVVLAVVGCGHCRECLAGRMPYCEKSEGLAGQFAEYSVVPESNLVSLPEDISFECGCLLSDSLGTPARAVRRSGAGEGDIAAVFGCGPIGLNCIQVLRAADAAVIAVDPVAYRREAALRLGAREAIDPSGGDPASQLRELTGGGPDLAFECCGLAGREALRAVRRGGRVAFVGECGSLEVSPSEDFIRRHIEVFGSWYLTVRDYWRNVELVRSGRADPMRIVTHLLPFEEIGRGFEVFFGHKENALKVVLRFPAEQQEVSVLAQNGQATPPGSLEKTSPLTGKP